MENFENIVKASNKKLSPDEVKNVLKEFESEGVSVEGEHFILTGKDGNKAYIPTWESVPYSKTGKHEDAVGIPIEDYLSRKIEEQDQESRGMDKAA